jgi:single-stranded-DNA-specific exonuclease
MMPRTDENEIMIAEGLNYVKSSWRPGLQALFELASIISLDFFQQIYKINSLLNVRDVENQLPAAFRLLTSMTSSDAKLLAEKLLEKSVQRKGKIKEMTEGLEKKIEKSSKSPIIFEGNSDWEIALLGVMASIISQKYQKPAFLYKKGEKDSQGGIRAPSGFNVVEAMKTCSRLLTTYGGHPQAAGFRVKNENLEEFKNCLIDYYSRK